MAATTVAIRLRRSTPDHDAYTVRVADRRRFTVLATARAADARRWVSAARWLHPGLIRRGRLVVGLGVQWTAPLRPLDGPPVPATLQLCVGLRCLVFHLARANLVPETLRRFLADPRVTFVGHGSAHDCRMLAAHFGIRVACGRELRAMAGMGNASMEAMADRILGYPGISKSRDVAMSDWHEPLRLSVDQVLYAALDAFIAYRLGVHLCPRQRSRAQQVVVERSPPTQAFCGLAIVAEAAPPSDDSEVAAANNTTTTSSKVVVDTAGGAGLTLTAGSDTTDSDTTTHGLPVVRADASDSDDSADDDGFDRVAIEASDDDEDEFYVLL